MFGVKQKPRGFSSSEDDMSVTAGILEEKAVAAEVEALHKAEDLLSSYEAEHRNQCAGYVFDCRRWGDFLTLFVQRKANAAGGWNPGPDKVAASLNLGSVSRIRIVEGHAPDRQHLLKYRFKMIGTDGVAFETGSLQSGFEYTVYPDYPYLPEGRPLLVENKKHTSYGIVTTGGNHRIRYSTKNFPRPAEDDVIFFDGIGQELHAPAGMGQQIYNSIMAEIERGWLTASQTP